MAAPTAETCVLEPRSEINWSYLPPLITFLISVKLLSQIYPNMKLDEVETLARISTKKEIKQLAKDHGYEKVDI